MVLELGNDVVWGTFCIRFMVFKFVNGDHFSIMGNIMPWNKDDVMAFMAYMKLHPKKML